MFNSYIFEKRAKEFEHTKALLHHRQSLQEKHLEEREIMANKYKTKVSRFVQEVSLLTQIIEKPIRTHPYDRYGPDKPYEFRTFRDKGTVSYP